MSLLKNSIGIGDRFAQEAEAQLTAIMKAADKGTYITPVWNKSFREHDIIKSHPSETREKADLAVKNLGWTSSYYTDADHINLNTVDFFLHHSDFFTLDVAELINQPSSNEELEVFLKNFEPFLGELLIPGIEKSYLINEEFLEDIAGKYLQPSLLAKRIYHRINSFKGTGNFITEVSMDEVIQPQSPIEIFFVLGLLKDIPLDTIASKLIGQFYKGIDYIGDIDKFEEYFKELLLILSHAKNTFGLQENLKLSIHSGSDKFSIYPVIRKLSAKYNQGIHLKTAGTTWLEEVIGLAMSGGEALSTVKTIYQKSYNRLTELTRPYESVIDINHQSLPDPEIVGRWDGDFFAATLRHIRDHKYYNPHFRQLLHIGYKIAAEMGQQYISQLKKHHSMVSQQVIENLFERHITPLFP